MHSIKSRAILYAIILFYLPTLHILSYNRETWELAIFRDYCISLIKLIFFCAVHKFVHQLCGVYGASLVEFYRVSSSN